MIYFMSLLGIFAVGLAIFVSRKVRRAVPTAEAKLNASEFPSRNPLWATGPDAVLDITPAETGIASAAPETIWSVMCRAAELQGDSPALINHPNAASCSSLSWVGYEKLAREVSKSLTELGATKNSCVSIMAFNSPEWFATTVAAAQIGCKSTGIYLTNSADAAQYIVKHSESLVVFVDSVVQLQKVASFADSLQSLRAVVAWGDAAVAISKAPTNIVSCATEVMPWADFIAVGKSVSDQTIETAAAAVRPGECCSLIYTSGTTGPPKGCMLTHDNVLFTAKALLETFGFPRPGNQRAVSYLPLSHIAGQLVDLYLPLVYAATPGAEGATVYFARADALQGSLGDSVKAAKPTLFGGVPRVWEKYMARIIDGVSVALPHRRWLVRKARQLMQESVQNMQVGGSGEAHPMAAVLDALVLSKVRRKAGLDSGVVFWTGAAPMSNDVRDFFDSINVHINNVYGLSETAGIVALSKPSVYKLGAAGQAIDGVEVCIKGHADAPAGEGEICCRGRNVMMGYFKDAARTSHTIDEEGWLHTGDLGRMDPATGFLQVTGRLKELIITAGGENIAPVPIEEAIMSLAPHLGGVMVVGDGRKYLVCLVTLETESATLNVPTTRLTKEGGALSASSNTIEEAVHDPVWIEYIQTALDTYNSTKAVSRAQRVQKFAILPEEFTVDGGDLTPTMKLKRSAVAQKYAEVVEQLYA